MDNRPSADHWFLQMLDVVKLRATCPRRQVGCILVDSENRILSTGYNGVPRHQSHCINPDTRCDGFADQPGNTSRCLAIHAEQNALMQCLDLDRVSVVYCSASPCLVCTRLLLNLRHLRRIVFVDLYPDEVALHLWKPREILEHHGTNGSVRYLDRKAEGLVWFQA
jgi:dCMP deaminase